jgi:hypothetical protein
MRKLPALFILLLLLTTQTWAQDTAAVVARVIFIGDAGEIDPEQSTVISHNKGRLFG